MLILLDTILFCVWILLDLAATEVSEMAKSYGANENFAQIAHTTSSFVILLQVIIYLIKDMIEAIKGLFEEYKKIKTKDASFKNKEEKNKLNTKNRKKSKKKK